MFACKRMDNNYQLNGIQAKTNEEKLETIGEEKDKLNQCKIKKTRTNAQGRMVTSTNGH